MKGLKLKNLSRLFLFFVPVTIFIISCDNSGIDPNAKTLSSCESCHTDYSLLQEVYSVDTVEAAGGCGGDAPHYEPYDRVFMGGSGYEAYQNSAHYSIGCVGCHNGDDKAKDKTLAHSGEFIAHPSMEYQEKCGSCHSTITENFTTSLHHGTGQKRKVTMRSGLAGPEEFDKLPQHQIEGYTANCATCHGTCGNCHVVRPAIGGGGLAKGHDFAQQPDMISVCVTCHTSRGGHAYLGVASGTVPDVHLTKKGFTCTNCHTGAELHGHGEPVEQRYAYSELPKCENCHTEVATKNSYHTRHFDDFNCQVCHSQDYNNCGSCHIHGDGARVSSYMDFKIARNPIPDIKTGFDLVLVRRTLAAPDNWEKYDVAEYENFDVFPTYNFTTPHNILKWTSRTEVEEGASCFANCHIRNEDGVLVNKELYLFEEDLLEWEKGATSFMTVDGVLPGSWSK